MGACDDISGTVTILEIARSLAILRDEYGWRPKRSLMFGSWDGEEWGLYGSVDFNEQTNETNPWIDNIVAYLNFDMTVVGGGLLLWGNPLMRQLLLDSAKQIKYPYQQWIQYNHNPNNYNNESDYEFNLYDTWWNFTQNAKNDLTLPEDNTDFGAFEFYSGIPSAAAGFANIPNSLYWTENAYTYHTFYDLNNWLDIVDPKWDYAQTMAQYGGLIMLRLSEYDILPFDVTRLGIKLYEWATIDLPNYANNSNCTVAEELYLRLENVTMYFKNSTFVYNEFIEDNTLNDDTNIEKVEEINFVLKNMMKRLTLKADNDEGDGLISNPWYNQVIFKPSSSRYPYIGDTIARACDQSDIERAFNLTIQYIENAVMLIAP